MRTLPVALAALGLVSVAGCAGIQQAATDLGVSVAVQQACTAAVAQEIPGISEDTDFDLVLDRLEANGKACLIAAVKDVLMAQIVAVPPAAAGEVIAADAKAAAAI